MLGARQNNSDGRHIYYPIAALILTTWELVESLGTDKEATSDHPIKTAVEGGIDLLMVSLPILGSALNGLAKDAGHMWIWWIVRQMQCQGQSADRDEVSMLLEVSQGFKIRLRLLTLGFVMHAIACHAEFVRRSVRRRSIRPPSLVCRATLSRKGLKR